MSEQNQDRIGTSPSPFEEQDDDSDDTSQASTAENDTASEAAEPSEPEPSSAGSDSTDSTELDLTEAPLIPASITDLRSPDQRWNEDRDRSTLLLTDLTQEVDESLLRRAKYDLDPDVKSSDCREAAMLVAAAHCDEVIDLLRHWGYGRDGGLPDDDHPA